MKKSILIMLLSCCIIIAFSVPVLATSYTWTQGGNATKVKYDFKSVDESTVLTAIQEACGTTENVYYVCVVGTTSSNNLEYKDNLRVYIMLDIEAAGIKGNVGYVKDDSNGLYTDSFNTVPHWKQISISNKGTYISRYSDSSSDRPWTRYVGMPEHVTITNIPVFNTKEGLDEYFETGNTWDMIGSGGKYSSDVPIVEDAYVSYKSNYSDHVTLYVNFNFPENSEKYTATIYQRMKSNIYIQGLSYKKTEFYYEGSLFKLQDMEYMSIPVKIEQTKAEWDKLEDEIIAIDAGIIGNGGGVSGGHFGGNAATKYKNESKYFFCPYPVMEFYIQLSDGTQKGDIVKLEIDCANLKKGGLLDVVTGENTGEGVGTILDGSTDIDDVGNATVKDNYVFGDGNTNGFDSIVSNVSNMFGLIGDNGIIAMLGQIFGFLPKEIIILLVGTFSIVCMVIVIKFTGKV